MTIIAKALIGVFLTVGTAVGGGLAAYYSKEECKKEPECSPPNSGKCCPRQ